MEGRKEGNVLFNEVLNTFYIRLYDIRHMVKDHSDSKRGNPLPPHGLLFPINSKGSLYAPSHRQDSTYHGLCYTSRGSLAGTSNDEYVHHPTDRLTHTMVRWFVESILHGGPLELFLIPASAPRRCNKGVCYPNKGCGMCYPVCGMVPIKQPMLLIGKSSPCGSSGFPLSLTLTLTLTLSEWSFTICLTP